MNTTRLIALVATALIGFSGFGLAADTTWTNDGFITGTEAGKVLPYAYMSAAAYRVESKPVAGFELVTYANLPPALQKYYVGMLTSPKTKATYDACMLVDKDSGMQARLYKAVDSDTYVLAFSGSDIDITVRGAYNMMTNVANAAGYESTVYAQAADWMKSVIEQYPDACVIATGTSLGGGLAQYATLMNKMQVISKGETITHNVKAYCFNDPALTGAQLGNVILANKIPAADPQKPSTASLRLMDSIARPIITHVYVEGEWASGYHPGYWFGKQYTVRFYDQSWKGYYSKNHHDAYAVRKSLEKAAGVATSGTIETSTATKPGVLVVDNASTSTTGSATDTTIINPTPLGTGVSKRIETAANP